MSRGEMILALTLTLSLQACSRFVQAKESSDNKPENTQIILLVDTSASRDSEELDREKRLADAAINHLTPGDRLLVMPVDPPAKGIHPIDFTVDPKTRTKDLKGVREELRAGILPIFSVDNAHKAPQTDLLKTLHDASEMERDFRGKAVIAIISDMFQSDGKIEMEGLRRMPPKDLIAEMKAGHELPDFRGACVMVVGIDTARKEFVPVRAFWQEYFASAGTELRSENYRHTPPSSPTCE